MKTGNSACCSSSLCLKPCHTSSALIPMTLLSSLNCSRNVSGVSWFGKKQWRRKDWVNARKTKIDLWYGPGPPAEFRWGSCAVCRTGVGRNRIFCTGCKHWVHKKCSGIKCLAKDPDYRCTQCQRSAHPLDSRPHREVQVGPDKLEVVASFCYLETCFQQPIAVNFEPQQVWKPPGRSSRSWYWFFFPTTLKTNGHVYRCCV